MMASSSPKVPVAQYQGETKKKVANFAKKRLSKAFKLFKDDSRFLDGVQYLLNWLEEEANNSMAVNVIFNKMQMIRSLAAKLQIEKNQLIVEMKTAGEKYETIVWKLLHFERIFAALRQKRIFDYFSRIQRKKVDEWLTEMVKNRELQEYASKRLGSDEQTLKDNVNLNQKMIDYQSEILTLKKQHKVALELKNKEIIRLENSIKLVKEDLKVQEIEQKNKISQFENVERAYGKILLENESNEADLERKLNEERLKTVILEVEKDKLKRQLTDVEQKLSNKNLADLDIRLREIPYQQVNLKEQSRSFSTNNHNENFTVRDAKLIAIISTFLLVHPFGIDFDNILAHVKRIDAVASGDEVKSVLNRSSAIFNQQSTEDNKWKLNLHSQLGAETTPIKENPPSKSLAKKKGGVDKSPVKKCRFLKLAKKKKNEMKKKNEAEIRLILTENKPKTNPEPSKNGFISEAEEERLTKICREFKTNAVWSPELTRRMQEIAIYKQSFSFIIGVSGEDSIRIEVPSVTKEELEVFRHTITIPDHYPEEEMLLQNHNTNPNVQNAIEVFTKSFATWRQPKSGTNDATQMQQTSQNVWKTLRKFQENARDVFVFHGAEAAAEKSLSDILTIAVNQKSCNPKETCKTSDKGNVPVGLVGICKDKKSSGMIQKESRPEANTETVQVLDSSKERYPNKFVVEANISGIVDKNKYSIQRQPQKSILADEDTLKSNLSLVETSNKLDKNVKELIGSLNDAGEAEECSESAQPLKGVKTLPEPLESSNIPQKTIEDRSLQALNHSQTDEGTKSVGGVKDNQQAPKEVKVATLLPQIPYRKPPILVLNPEKVDAENLSRKRRQFLQDLFEPPSKLRKFSGKTSQPQEESKEKKTEHPKENNLISESSKNVLELERLHVKADTYIEIASKKRKFDSTNEGVTKSSKGFQASHDLSIDLTVDIEECHDDNGKPSKTSEESRISSKLPKQSEKTSAKVRDDKSRNEDMNSSSRDKTSKLVETQTELLKNLPQHNKSKKGPVKVRTKTKQKSSSDKECTSKRHRNAEAADKLLLDVPTNALNQKSCDPKGTCNISNEGNVSVELGDISKGEKSFGMAQYQSKPEANTGTVQVLDSSKEKYPKKFVVEADISGIVDKNKDFIQRQLCIDPQPQKSILVDEDTLKINLALVETQSELEKYLTQHNFKISSRNKTNEDSVRDRTKAKQKSSSDKESTSEMQNSTVKRPKHREDKIVNTSGNKKQCGVDRQRFDEEEACTPVSILQQEPHTIEQMETTENPSKIKELPTDIKCKEEITDNKDHLENLVSAGLLPKKPGDFQTLPGDKGQFGECQVKKEKVEEDSQTEHTVEDPDKCQTQEDDVKMDFDETIIKKEYLDETGERDTFEEFSKNAQEVRNALHELFGNSQKMP